MNGSNKLLSSEIIVKLLFPSKNLIWILLILKKEKSKWKKMKLKKLFLKDLVVVKPNKKVKKKFLTSLLTLWPKKLNMKD
jgi:hypothetical protein